MSYTVDLIVAPLPQPDAKAWEAVEKLREVYYDDERDKAPALLTLLAALTARYPCLSTYGDADDGVDDCPWADGPMLNNFAHEMGMLAIASPRVEELLPFIVEESNRLGITVADGQSGKIHRP